ncbi:hypothetical protein BGZ74_005735, partial [Mortierella antarctica]
MPEEMQMLKLGGPIALPKAQSNQTLEYCTREASQIFGGLAYTRGLGCEWRDWKSGLIITAC